MHWKLHISIFLTLLLQWLHVTKWAPVHLGNVDIHLAGQIATLVEISEALLLLFHGRRGGCTQNVLEWAPPGTIFSHKPQFFFFQERCQSLSETEAEGKQRGWVWGQQRWLFSFIWSFNQRNKGARGWGHEIHCYLLSSMTESLRWI